MNKAQLIADIESKCGGEILATECVETVGDVKRYISNVFTNGEDSNAVPIAQKRNISWYVYDEGGAGETAYYSDRSFINPEAKNATGSDLADIEAIYNNQSLRSRVTGVICKGIRASGGAVAKYWVTDSAGVINIFMSWVASNATIQSNGGAASDSDLEYVVLTEAWSNIETVLT